jgi:hypothetical protein
MKYIHNGLFRAIAGKPVKIKDIENKVEEHEATVGEILRLCLQIYDTEHQGFVTRYGFVLSPTEIRVFNRLCDTFNTAPDGEWYSLETEPDFKLLQKVANWVSPYGPWWRHAPTIEDLLNRAPDQLPKVAAEK